MSRGVFTKVLLGVVVGVFLAAVIAGLWLLGPLSEQRSRKLDERRISDLRNVKSSITGYWNRHKKLPKDLATIRGEPGVAFASTDPVSGKPYVYRVKGDQTYELCADFETESEGPLGDWSHGIGEKCFEFEIKK